MRDLTSDNGKYYSVQQGDGNFALYERYNDGSLGLPLWDSFSYESRNTGNNPVPSIPSNPPIPGNSSSVADPILITKGCNPIGMAYWRNINQHKGQSILQVLLSIHDKLTLFTINKSNLQVLSQRELGINHTGEGCYFSAINNNIFFLPINNELFTYDINANDITRIWLLDPTQGDSLWQIHSSYAERVHSASIKDANYNIIKWAVHNSETGNTKYYDLKGEPDECQIDAGGKWLVIKEDNYNRIINLDTDAETIISNEQGAVGHSDCGFGLILGENDMSSYPGACDMIKFDTMHHGIMFSTGIWNMGYVSFTNVKPNIPLEQQRVLMSTPSELISVKLDGQGIGNKVCDNLTQNQNYENRPKANLCPEGEYAVWTALVNGSLNAYIVKIPMS